MVAADPAATGAGRLRQAARAVTGRSRRRADEAEPAEGAAGERKPKSGPVRLLTRTLVVLVVGFAALLWVGYVAPSPGRSVTLDAVYELAGKNQIKKATLLDQDSVIIVERCMAAPSEPPPADDSRPRRCYDRLTETLHAAYPGSDVATQQLIAAMTTESGADIEVDKQTPVAMARLLATFVVPLLLLANLFGLILLSGKGEGALGDVAGFARFRRGQRGGDAGKVVTFADVAGAEEAVTELREVIDYLTDPDRFRDYGAAPPKGVLLFGAPGCGKTLLARATAGESGVPFFSASGTEFVESLVGVGAARVRDLFRQVREAAPAILFIDEIDAVGRRRSGEGMSGGEREQTLNQLLVEMDGFEVSSGIVVMAATNRPDILDSALMRPGRFDRHITMEPPDVHGRHAILELHLRGRPVADDVDMAVLAQRTPGFTGADLANVINEAALLAIRQAPGIPISARHLSEGVLRVLHGPQRRGRLLSEPERRRLAYHEGGHALVSAALGQDEVHRVSIVARGRALAQSSLRSDERSLLTVSEMEDRLAAAMAGVAAEVMALGESSTTAEDDVRQATGIAREMVGLYGMSSTLGWVRMLNRNDGYLGSDGPSLDLVSGPTMAEFDMEVRRLTAAARQRAEQVLAANIDRLEEMVAALLEHETLEGPSLRPHLEGLTVPADGAGSAKPATGRRPAKR